jgi:acetyl/propionyl-CoA carboxylase alpha subunit
MSPVPWGPALRTIVSKVEASDVRELEVRAGGLRIKLRRDQVADASGLHTIRCPLTGIWYDSPAPGAPPFVSIGDSLDVGTIVGLVETMKVFNEVVADAAGVVRNVFVKRGALITEQAPLMAIEPAEDEPTGPAGQFQ